MDSFFLKSDRCYILFLIASICFGSCQQAVMVEGTGFDEPADPGTIPLALWEEVPSGVNVAFGSIDNRYDYHFPPNTTGSGSWNGTAWRGERVSFQLKIWSVEPVHNIEISAGDLRSGEGALIEGEQINIYPVRFLLTDEFLGGCGWRDKDTIPVHLVSDMFEHNQMFNLEQYSLRPVWITVDVPESAVAGVYEGKVTFSYREGRNIELPFTIEVKNIVLPPPSKWSFHLDLWQNPFAVARYHDVELWSEEHWDLLPPYVEMLAGAGQKCITTSILYRPWGGQTFDHFESMVEWTHLGNGNWEFDYSVFDRWVNLAMNAGITEQINCYSMVPWGNQVRYYDVDSADYVVQRLTPGSEQYMEIWRPFLESFRDHLQEKGWLDRTLIAMDERGLEEMKGMISLVKDVAPEFKIALAGNYLEEINDDIHDLCVHIRPELDKELIADRVSRGMPTTFYTMCARPEHPNNFTFSPPAEQAWIGWHSASRGFTGFLRWAYNSWVEDPVRDSRFRTWPAGDTYQIYPGPKSSIRFERLREGIQDFEKIRIIREIASQAGEYEVFDELDRILEGFTVGEIQQTPADIWLNRGKAELERLSSWAAAR